jgi:hypothetical protein
MIYLSAQTDHPYYHWQVEVMILNFMRLGINPNHIEAVFCYQHKVSDAGRALANAYPFVRVFWYENTIKDNGGYASLIRPHVLAKHFDVYPNLAKEVICYHDCDIMFRALPDWGSMTQDETCYLSDTISYIGSKYIQSKGADVLDKMAEIVGLNPKVIIDNEQNSGGAQYLIKGIDAEYWRKVERDAKNLYVYMAQREEAERKTLTPEQLKTYNPIQKWCADMWAVLWNLWMRGRQTRISPQLSFSWATSSATEWDRHNIYHNAGVTEVLKATHFYKGEYIQRDPFEADLSYVRQDNCTWQYVQSILRAKEERKRYRSAPPPGT